MNNVSNKSLGLNETLCFKGTIMVTKTLSGTKRKSRGRINPTPTHETQGQL